MNINSRMDAGTLCVGVEGRLDTMTAPELEAELQKCRGSSRLLQAPPARLTYIRPRLRRSSCLQLQFRQ